jgi:hypothetical protein
LGDARARPDGTYLIEYPPPTDGASVDFVVRIVEGAKTLVESSVVYAARPSETVNLSLAGEYRGPSAFTSLMNAITAELDGVVMAELAQNAKQRDLSFLANALKADLSSVAHLALVHKVAARAPGIPPQVFFALFRGAIPSELGRVAVARRCGNGDVFVHRVRDEARSAAATPATSKTVTGSRNIDRSLLESTFLTN